MDPPKCLGWTYSVDREMCRTCQVQQLCRAAIEFRGRGVIEGVELNMWLWMFNDSFGRFPKIRELASIFREV